MGPFRMIKIRQAVKARQYELLEGVLYKRSFLKPWLRCVGPLQADYVIREIHEGSCSMLTGPRSVVAKAIRLGYYWPTMHRDARDMIRKWAKKGQVFDSRYGLFYEVDRGESRGDNHRLSGEEVRVGQHSCRFGLLGEIVSNNGKQFSNNPFKDWCEKLNITQLFASVKHPQSNGLVERANRSLDEGIKARLGEGNKNWIEGLPHVLWAHRTMIKSSHGDTPFSLTYRTDAVIPVKIEMPMYRTAYYNARVRGVTFRPGDFVYRSNDASHPMDGGKLGPKWEGPYEVIEALGDETYMLRSMDELVLPRT
uniref:Reverse transcriptase domain-containing protein n=1 Tax=Tanacetum cinerariifolium TaxID=118510 RepID=A0A6L2J924_TANCI|nr:reverse transcriptase domain-containing protein [Tanacetum cinerariifolium]